MRANFGQRGAEFRSLIATVGEQFLKKRKHPEQGRHDVLSTGCQWRAIPKDLPPKSTVYDYFDLWTYDGTLQRIHHALYEQCREQAQREPSPTAAIIDICS